MSEDIDVDKELGIMAKRGDVQHAGFDEGGSDLFQMTPQGVQHAEELIKRDPEMAIYILQVAWRSDKNIEHFKQMLARVCLLYGIQKEQVKPK